MANGALTVSHTRAYQLSVLAHLKVYQFYHAYKLSALSALHFYHFLAPLPGVPFYQFNHFTALVSFTILPSESISGHVGFNIFIIPRRFRLSRFTILPIHHFSALNGCAILPYVSISAVSVLTFFHFCLRPTCFTIFPNFTNLPILPFRRGC